MTYNDQLSRTSTDRLLDLLPPADASQISIIETQFRLNDFPILLGRRFNGNFIGLFPASSEENVASPVQLSNGFEVRGFSPIDESSAANTNYVEFGNISNVDVILFGAVLDEVIRVVQDGSSIVAEIKQVVDRWRSLLSLDTPNALSVNKIIGLMGELDFLRHLLESKLIRSTTSWVGPNGSRHDFEFTDLSIEVKTTIRKKSNEISVHGFDQMNPFPGKTVRVLKTRMEPNPQGVSLNEQITKIENLLDGNRTDFMEKIFRTGYRREDSDLYANIKFTFIDYQDIPVDARFPLISRNTLQGIDSDRRIQDIEYVVDVTGLASQTANKLSEMDWQFSE